MTHYSRLGVQAPRGDVHGHPGVATPKAFGVFFHPSWTVTNKSERGLSRITQILFQK